MRHQKSFKGSQPTLYIVATPIGNREEMTPRAITILKEVDVIACEDTRSSAPLLKHFDIHTKRISYHKHNEHSSAEGILQLLESGNSVALISDAGYPLISDPGYILVRLVSDKGFPVVPVSGSSAFLNALVVSGLDTTRFSFLGFLEHKEKAMVDQLTAVKERAETLIYYVAVHRIEKSLETVREVLGNRQICLARELTKMHEAFICGTVSEVIEELDVLKGEFVLVIEGNTEQPLKEVTDYFSLIDEAIAEGFSPSRAVAHIAKTHNLSKNVLYQEYIAKKEEML